MKFLRAQHAACLLPALAVSTGAQAAERRFMPIAASLAQRIDVVDLPRQSGDAPAAMTVTIRVGGDALGFAFREVQ